MLQQMMDNYKKQAAEEKQARDQEAQAFKQLVISQFEKTLKSWFGDIYSELEWADIEYEINREQTHYHVAVSFKIPGLEFAECAVSNGKAKIKTYDSPPLSEYPVLAIKVPYNDGSSRDWWERQYLAYVLVGMGDNIRLIGADPNEHKTNSLKIAQMFVWAEEKNRLSREAMANLQADRDRREYGSMVSTWLRNADNLHQLEEGYHKMVMKYPDHEPEFVQVYYERKEALIRASNIEAEREQQRIDYEEAERIAIEKVKELWKPFVLYRISYLMGENSEDGEALTDFIFSLRPYSQPATGPGNYGWWMQLVDGEIRKVNLIHVYKIDEFICRSADDVPFGVLHQDSLTVEYKGLSATVRYKVPPDPDFNPIYYQE